MTESIAPLKRITDPHDIARDALRQRQFDAAQKYLNAALEKNPDDAAALSLMIDVYIGQRDAPQAIRYAIRAIKADNDDIANKKKFLRLAGNIFYRQYIPDIEYAVLTCLETPDLEFESAPLLWISILFLMPAFRQLHAQVWWRDVLRSRLFPWMKNPFNAVGDFRPLLYPYFLLGVKRVVVPSPRFERFMVLLRAFLLEQAESSRPKLTAADYRALVISVAHYAFHTEYILDVTEPEQRKVDALRLQIETGADAARDAASIALLACYVPLASLKNAETVAKNFADAPDMAELVNEQIADYLDLQRATSNVTALTPVDDALSEKVRAQYESFPYPRWREISQTLVTWDEKARTHLSRPHAAALIAGCGTGMEACHIAAAFPNTDMLAVDITRASLAYAISKAEKYSLKNMTFKQADILRLGELDRKFDYIQCFGVLHHMNDPEKGWAILARLLKPDGVMFIGLYSETARRAVVEARAAIAKGDYASTPKDMRRFRRDSRKLLGKESMAALLQLGDYYHLNMYRDLLFHVHEDRFTIPRIKTALEKLGLVFGGFDLPDAVLNQYRQMFPDDPAGLNLDHWHIFEQTHPDTFRGCYQLLCARAAGAVAE